MQCKFTSKENLKCSNECYDKEYCLFHKKNKTNIENEKMIFLIKKNKISNFEGFIFEIDFICSEVITFDYDYLNFNEAIFTKRAMFNYFEFKGEVSFDYAKFLSFYTFESSKFLKSVSFNKTYFYSLSSNEKLFNNVEILGQNFNLKRCINLPRMDGIKFGNCTKIIMIDIKYPNKNYLPAKINYKIAKTQANKIDDYERIGYYYYKERTFGSKCINKKDYPRNIDYLSAKFFDYLARYVLGYGERPFNILIVTIFIISIFAFFYMITGLRTLEGEVICIDLSKIKTYQKDYLLSTYIDFWYFSLVTFTTLGYGDMTVNSSIGKILVALEVFFGVTIASTWTSVIIKRLIR